MRGQRRLGLADGPRSTVRFRPRRSSSGPRSPPLGSCCRGHRSSLVARTPAGISTSGVSRRRVTRRCYWSSRRLARRPHRSIVGPIGKALGGFFGSAPVQFALQAIAVYLIILWLAGAYWAFRDMQQRTENPILPYVAASFIIIFTPIFFPLAIFVYKIIRPHEKIGEVYERNLAEEALLAEAEAIK